MMRDLYPSAVGLTAVAAGQTYNLNDRAEIFLELYDLGMAPIRRISQRAPAQDGDTDLGGLIDPRFIDLAWRIDGRGRLDRYRELRELLFSVFRRNSPPVQLIFDFGNGRRRATDVFLDVVLGSTARRHTQEILSGVFKASDPRLYDPQMRIVNFTLIPDSGGLPIPWSIPIPIGGSTLNSIETIFYANGSRLASAEYPIITIHGPISSPEVRNLTTDETISLSANGGLDIALGQFVQIDLSGQSRRDAKTIRDQNGNSVAQYLTADSDLASFHFAFAGEAVPSSPTPSDGNNRIWVLGSNVTLQSRVTITYYDRYEGV